MLYFTEYAISPDGKNEIGACVSQALTDAHLDVHSITGIVVDIGPGGTSSVRTGVAFANGLAYSLHVPILPVSAFEMIGIEAYEQFRRPVVTVIPSIKGNVYLGIYDGQSVTTHYGPIADLAALIDNEFTSIAIAGYEKARVALASQLQTCQFSDAGIQKVNAKRMLSLFHSLTNRLQTYPNLPIPITESTL
ncbi:tRNA (adenosine(37)-N6)-threonylcarbamoyltransferase complex dimerization subunit type 1 TsaB [Spirosoma koreense]